jgi:hypothetical protein
MSFIKNGDGKIVGVIDAEVLTEEQKKAVKTMTKDLVKPTEEKPLDKTKDDTAC